MEMPAPKSPLKRFDRPREGAHPERAKETPPPAPTPELPAIKEKLEEERAAIPEVQEEKQGFFARFIPSKKRPLPPPLRQKDALTKKIEAVMSEGLMDIFTALPPTTKVEFRAKGEETAQKISELMQRAKVSLKNLLKLLLEWLQIVPGVNKFFIEQEAKIKAERILALREENKHT